jgi:hypothetical protein
MTRRPPAPDASMVALLPYYASKATMLAIGGAR